MKTFRLLALALLIACVVSIFAATAATAGPDNYPSYGDKSTMRSADLFGTGGVQTADLPDNYPSYGNK
jgi:hypothetical protein